MATHSAAIALSGDGSTIFVANPDLDSIAVVDVEARALRREVFLAEGPPAADASGAFTPAVMPRALAVGGGAVYATGQRSGRVYAVDAASGAVRSSSRLCSEPIGILASPDGESLYVACSQDDLVLRLDAATLARTGDASVGHAPWALAWAADGEALLVSHLLSPQVSVIDPAALAAGAPLKIAEVPPRGDRRLAHGTPRAFYDLALRPGTRELWLPHMLLGIDTPQPELDFESTAFAALTVLPGGAGAQRTLSVSAPGVRGTNGAFTDVVSGPRAIAFTKDGAYALVVDAASEDVLVVDARRGVESSILRPLPGHQPEAIALAGDERHAFLYERNTSDVVVLDVHRTSDWLTLAVSGPPIATTARDAMPAKLRLGQHVFNSANSAEYRVTRSHWVACATCHVEGRSDEVTWLFAQGRRDTPTNAGGVLGTGFLFRTADRARVQDYWQTIDVEQGGHFDPANAADAALLDALADYVNLAIPAPVPPRTDPALVAHGAAAFAGAGCGTCHGGARLTDSGAGNAALDLAGPLQLHDVGTCVTAGASPDVAHDALDGSARAACLFDTPSLTGVASTPPYLHDGSAATLLDAVTVMAAKAGGPGVSEDDAAAIAEYLRSL